MTALYATVVSAVPSLTCFFLIPYLVMNVGIQLHAQDLQLASFHVPVIDKALVFCADVHSLCQLPADRCYLSIELGQPSSLFG
eukprot:m.212243 g.212243  ORF g.212243 m.212243 type:complete len:83 (-) comp16946_c2_seq8:2477-2725(-)